MTQEILRERLDEFNLVDDSDLDAAWRMLARQAHTLAEGAGAAALAALLKLEERPVKTAIILSGGNADERELASL